MIGSTGQRHTQLCVTGYFRLSIFSLGDIRVLSLSNRPFRPSSFTLVFIISRLFLLLIVPYSVLLQPL